MTMDRISYPADHPREACGLFGIYNVPDPAPIIYAGLFALQHRGQEGAGMVVSDGQRARQFKGLGLVSQVFGPGTLDSLTGNLGIGHARYSTTGSSRIQHVQPIVVECVDGVWAIAHNGNLVNAQALRQSYQRTGINIAQTLFDLI